MTKNLHLVTEIQLWIRYSVHIWIKAFDLLRKTTKIAFVNNQRKYCFYGHCPYCWDKIPDDCNFREERFIWFMVWCLLPACRAAWHDSGPWWRRNLRKRSLQEEATPQGAGALDQVSPPNTWFLCSVPVTQTHFKEPIHACVLGASLDIKPVIVLSIHF